MEGTEFTKTHIVSLTLTDVNEYGLPGYKAYEFELTVVPPGYNPPRFVDELALVRVHTVAAELAWSYTLPEIFTQEP